MTRTKILRAGCKRMRVVAAKNSRKNKGGVENKGGERPFQAPLRDQSAARGTLDWLYRKIYERGVKCQ